MAIERLDSGPRMSEIVIHNDTVHLVGQVAENNAGKGADEQTREILEQIDSLLLRAGSDKSKLLSVTIYLADINDFDAMNSVWDAWLDRANPPPGPVSRRGWPDLNLLLKCRPSRLAERAE